MGLNVPEALADDALPGPDDILKKELHEALVPSVLRVPWAGSSFPLNLHFYYIKFVPSPADRKYRMFGLFLKSPLPKDAESLKVDLHLHHGRIVQTSLVPSGVVKFHSDEIMLAERFHKMSVKVILERSVYFSDFVSLGEESDSHETSSTFYLFLPVTVRSDSDDKTVDWETVQRCLSSPIFGNSAESEDLQPTRDSLKLRNGTFKVSDIINSFVFTPHNKKYFFVQGINHEKNAYSYKSGKYPTYDVYYKERGGKLSHPEQPFLIVKRLPDMHNLLLDRAHTKKEAQEVKEYFEEFSPEICVLKIFGFSKDMGSSLVMLPSLMHHLENLLVAVELKDMLSTFIPNISEISAHAVLQALTTQKSAARVSLERFEVLGDAFLKYIVSRQSFLSYATLSEGDLTAKRSAVVNNYNLYELAVKKNLQVYIRDELFHPSQFYAFGRSCPVVCSVDTEMTIHKCTKFRTMVPGVEPNDVKCTESHRWLTKKTIADAVESVVGALLVESGFVAAVSFLRWIGIEVDFDVSDVLRVNKESKNMPLVCDIDIAALERIMGHRFQNQCLLQQALVHSSYHSNLWGCYQKLEFLGDAALEYLITSYVFSTYPDLDPGQITDLKSVVVNNKSFAYIAVGRSLHLYLKHKSSALTGAIDKFSKYAQLSDSEKESLDEPPCPKILGDIVESCIGAMLVDTGFNMKLVWGAALQLLEPSLDFSTFHLNHVRELRELCQSVDLQYELPKPLKVEKGYCSSVEIYVKGNHLMFSVLNPSSKAGQRMAAQNALTELKSLGYKHKRRSLQEIVQSARKETPKLIGYNEEPISISESDYSSTDSEETSPTLSQDAGDSKDTNSKFLHFQEATPPNSLTAPEKPALSMIEPDTHSMFRQCQETTPSNLLPEPRKTASSTSVPKKAGPPPTARTDLYYTCGVNHWEPPSFVLHKEEGPSHQKKFTFKVIVRMGGIGAQELECYSDPKQQKKAAKEHAAEGALWYLEKVGHRKRK